MKVAVINTYNSKDINVWSGIPYHLSLMFDKVFGTDIQYISIPIKRNFLSYVRGFYHNKVKRRKYLTWTDESLIKRTKTLHNDLIDANFDLIITYEFFLIPILKSPKNRVIFWSDATFENLVDFYPYVSNLSSFSLTQGHSIQKKALAYSDAIILSSQWAINTAIDYYSAERHKISKIFFACNLKTLPDPQEINEIVSHRTSTIIKLLFIGVDWQRKGGDDAVAVVENLNSRGFQTVMFVVGTEIPAHHRSNENLIPFGFVDKNSTEGETQLTTLLKESSFLIIPSRADCTPVAFCEANSYGLPVITTDVGGIRSVVVTNINGQASEIPNFVQEATDFIIKFPLGSKQYKELCYSSYKYYESAYTWLEVERRFRKVLKSFSSSTLN